MAKAPPPADKARRIEALRDCRIFEAETDKGPSLAPAAKTDLRSALAGRQALFGALLDGANDAIWFVSREGKILEVNRAAEEMYGRSREALVSLDVASLRSEAARASAPAHLGEVLSRGRLVVETEHVRSDGTVFPVEVSTRLVGEGGEPVLLSVVRDVSERKKSEARVRQLNRLLKTISEVNQLIVRTEDRGSLLADACRILVEHGGFRMAWVGFADRESGLVVPAARAGEGVAYLDDSVIRFDDTPEGRGPTGTAVRTGRHVVAADLASEPTVLPWRARQLAHGFRSSGAFPIGARGAVTGALTVYAAEPSAVGDEETALLDELAGDIGYSLDAMESREARRKAEEKYRNIFENAVEGIVQTTPDGRFASVNPSFVRMLGYDSAEELASAIHDTGKQVWLHPEGRAAFRRHLEGQGVVKGLETDLRRKDGTIVWVSINACAVRDSTGAVAFYEGTVDDITERKRAEAALNEAGERLRLVVEGTGTGLWDWDLGTDRVRYSAEWKSLLGYREEEVGDDLGEWRRLTHPDDVEPTLAEVGAFLERPDTTLETEFRMRHKNGEYRWILSRAAKLLADDGRTTRLLGMHFDVTERRRAEEELREKQHILSESQRIAHVGSWSFEPSTGRTRWSDETYRLYGKTPDTFAPDPETFFALVHPEDRARMEEFFRACLSGEHPGELEFRAVLQDGSIRTLLTQGDYQHGPDHAALRMVGTVQDITERKRAEEQLHALAARLQSIREEEGTRIAREIHDEPGQNLTALKMDLAWLRRELAGRGATTDPAALVRHVDEMTALVDQTVETIQRISEELRPAALDKLGLAEAAGATVEEFQKRAGIASRLSCRLEGVEIDPDLATAAYRVLQELLTNVARHAEATRVDVVLEGSRGELLLEVRDDGRGITEAQGASSKSLGLAGIRERVSLAGGTFALEGAAGRGTRATARLPLRSRGPS